jgi:RHH-type proline utilization regulon transcriptional repressor/proline dehydrogenase/delta 1-pyrroline-5-carboxylate dehydrogenase
MVRFAADDLDALVNDINALGYGLTLGVHTRIDDAMERVARRARIGNIYVNRNQIGAVVGVQPFGGEGLSGTGPKAGGPHYLSALTKRQRPQNDTPAPVMDSELMSVEKAALAEAAGAYQRWAAADRASVVRSAMKALPDIPADLAGDIDAALRLFTTNTELPGPTGESNTLKLRARGTALCLNGGGHLHQMLLALAAGNPVIAVETPDATALAVALKTASAPPGLLSIVGHKVSDALLADRRLALVVHDGGRDARVAIETVLARREGSIIPLLSSLDAPWRFATERTLTINTTAAGGDVRLLSLGE